MERKAERIEVLRAKIDDHGFQGRREKQIFNYAVVSSETRGDIDSFADDVSEDKN